MTQVDSRCQFHALSLQPVAQLHVATVPRSAPTQHRHPASAIALVVATIKRTMATVLLPVVIGVGVGVVVIVIGVVVIVVSVVVL